MAEEKSNFWILGVVAVVAIVGIVLGLFGMNNASIIVPIQSTSGQMIPTTVSEDPAADIA
jgi:uncharacterized membrane protein YfcA